MIGAGLVDCPPGTSAYGAHLRHVLTATTRLRADLRQLLDGEELACADAILSLPVATQGLLCRLLIRKGPWFKVASVQGYQEVRGRDGTVHTQAMLTELVNAGLVRAFPPTGADGRQDTAATLLAVEACLTSAELKSVLTTLRITPAVNTPAVATPAAGSGTPAPSTESGHLKKLWFKQLCDYAASQSTLTGASLPLAKAVQRTLAESLHETAHTSASAASCDTSATPTFMKRSRSAIPALSSTPATRKAAPADSSKSLMCWLSSTPVPTPVAAVPTTSLNINQSRTSTGVHMLVGLPDHVQVLVRRLNSLYYLTVDGAHVSSAGFQTKQLLNAQADAVVGVSVMQAPGLLVIFRKLLFPPVVCNPAPPPVFPSRVHWLAYETAMRLWSSVEEHFAWFGDPTVGARGVHHTSEGTVVKVAALETQPEDVLTCDLRTTLQFNDWIGHEACNTLRRLLGCSHHDATTPSTDTVDTALDVLVTFRAARCLAAFLAWSDQFDVMQPRPALPPYLRKFSASWVFGDIVWAGVAVLERRQLFDAACGLLKLLLGSPITGRRRGKWWIRMAINLVHLNRAVDACVAVQAALSDTHVVGAERLDLQRRLARLQRNNGVAAQAKAAGLQSPSMLLDAIAVKSTPTVVSSVWDCPACTFVNSRGASKCVMCATPSPLAPATPTAAAGSPMSPVASLHTTAALMSPPPPPPSLARTPSSDSFNVNDADEASLVPHTPFSDVLATIVAAHVETGSIVTKRHLAEVQFVGNPLNSTTGEKSRFVGIGGSPSDPECLVTVEQLAIQHYATAPQDIPAGVFWVPYQDAPLDLDDRHSFFPNREAMLCDRLHQLCVASRQDLVRMLGDSWRAHHGQMCRGVSWTAYSLHHLQLVAACVGGVGLAAVFNAMCADHRHFSGGMPDLVLWRVLPIDAESSASLVPSAPVPAPPGDAGLQSPHSPQDEAQLGDADVAALEAEPPLDDDLQPSQPSLPDDIIVDEARFRYEFKLSEVKGPRDRLSDKQRVWIRILLAGGIHVELCKIIESDAKRRAAKTKAHNNMTLSNKKLRATDDDNHTVDLVDME